MLIVDGMIYCLQRHGGVTVYFNEIIKRLCSEDIAFQLLSYETKYAHETWDVMRNIVLNKRILERYRDCSMNCSGKIFHSSYYRLPTADIPAVTTVHDFTYEKYVSGPARWIHSWQKFRAIKKSKAIICVSHNTKKDLLHYIPELAEEKIFVVHNGVSELFFPIESADRPVRPYVLFVGSRAAYKNFELAVNVLSESENCDLLIVGGGALKKSEIELMEGCIAGRYRHAGFVTTEQLNVLYNQAHCLLYPSSYEGFGIPVLEAMRAGCPVVALNASSIPEVAGNGAILVDGLDVNAFACAIHGLSDESHRDNIRRRGLEQASKFSWDKTFDETMAVYECVLGHPLPRRN